MQFCAPRSQQHAEWSHSSTHGWLRHLLSSNGTRSAARMQGFPLQIQSMKILQCLEGKFSYQQAPTTTGHPLRGPSLRRN